MVTKRKPGRPKGSTNKPKSLAQQAKSNIKKNLHKWEQARLEGLVQKQDEVIAQGLDQVDDLLKQVDFYRKQVNHLLALCNILSKGA